MHPTWNREVDHDEPSRDVPGGYSQAPLPPHIDPVSILRSTPELAPFLNMFQSQHGSGSGSGSGGGNTMGLDPEAARMAREIFGNMQNQRSK